MPSNSLRGSSLPSERGFARLIGFSDGVVAIAITLLVLPLVESAADLTGDLNAYLEENYFHLFAFALSFTVIGRFWLAHHQMYEKVQGYNTPLLVANLFWLMTIVFLPFPTELLGTKTGDDAVINALYVGTMVLASLASVAQQWIIIRSPSLQSPQVRERVRLHPQVTILATLLVALVLAVAVPRAGLLALLLLFVAAPIEKLITRSRKDQA